MNTIYFACSITELPRLRGEEENIYMSGGNKTGNKLGGYLSPLGVWALAFGCSVGWGAFIMPGTTFLPIAGPLGTALGIVIGAAIMYIIGANYHYMMNRYPDAGGTFSYAKGEFGHDHAFLSAWFLVLTYVSIIWANATALALIARNLLGNTLQFGFHYTIAGYDVYMGELLLSASALIIFGFICAKWKRLAGALQIAFALILIIGILVTFGFTMANLKDGLSAFKPGFAPGKSPFAQVVAIVALAPWAFIGFESVSHSASEFRFSQKKSFLIIAIAVTTGAVAYLTLAEIAAAALPEGFANWTDYIAAVNSGELSGIEGIPTFFAAENAMGEIGSTVLGATLLGGVLTGLIGNMIAASRLLYSMSENEMLPSRFGKLSKSGAPKNAILFITAISLVIPFFGRTAIGWIVDVTTIGATIAYGYTSATAFKRAKREGRKLIMATGVIGLVMSAAFSIYLLIPNYLSAAPLATESYLILALWSIIGVIFFRTLFNKDKSRRLGKSTVAWIVLLFLIFFISLMWMHQSTNKSMEEFAANVNEYHTQEAVETGVSPDDPHLKAHEEYINSELDKMNDTVTRDSLIQMGLIVIALISMFNIYSVMQKREKSADIEKIKAEQSNKAKSSFLSNMSHDIRTPMNAITGYTALAKAEPDLSPKVREYLDKIDSSSQHLLGLINDVLDMGRIESGKIELRIEDADIVKIVTDACDVFIPQMNAKHIDYKVDVSEVDNRWVRCDDNRLSRILLNLVSNAYKFTPENGSVSVTLRQTGGADGVCDYELRVKDSGIGMSKEFAGHIFEAFERERSKTVEGIQGTGLGTAITKSFVDMMGGTIYVDTELGKGTEFIINLPFEKGEEVKTAAENETFDFTGMRILVAEDNPVNFEIAKLVLSKAGFEVDSAEDGAVALEKVRSSEPGRYDVVLMDFNMPNMSGLEAAEAIRALDDEKRASVPIVAMTANAFAEDVQAALDAGMNAHISKPIDVPGMLATLREVLARTH